MTFFLSNTRAADDHKGGRLQARASRAATLVTRLQGMQKQINAKNFSVLRLNGNGLPASCKLTCVLDNWGAAAEAMTRELVAAYGFDFRTEAEASVAAARPPKLGIPLRTPRRGFKNSMASA